MRESWKEYKLGEIVDLKQGFALNKKSNHYLAKDNKGIPLLKISDLKNGTETLFVKENIPEQFIVTPSEIIYSRTGQVGLAFMGKTGVVYNNCFKVIPREMVYSVFLYQWLNTSFVRTTISSLATGSAQPDLNHGAFKCVKINLPPLKTQRKIASILSAYDDLIENNLKRIKLLEEQAQQTYEEWFVRFKFPGYEDVEMDEDSGLPVGWEKVKLGEFAKTSSGGTPSRKKESEYYENGTIPWVKTGELKNFMLINSKEKITKLGLEKSSAKLFPKKTVLLAMYGNTIGETTFLTFEASTNQACCGFLVKNDTYKSYFLHQFLLNQKEYILNFRMGAAQENISQGIIQNIKFNRPSKDVLLEFEKQISPKYDLIEILYRQNQRLKEARDILLPRLMSGIIDVDGLEVGEKLGMVAEERENY